MAPELIKNDKCCEKIDVYVFFLNNFISHRFKFFFEFLKNSWSFGVLTWEMLTGSRPYSGVENARIMFGVCFNKLSLPIASFCPDGFKNILFKCLNNNSTYRPSFIGILSLLNDPSCLDFCSNTTLEEFNELKKNWSKDLSESFSNMNRLSIPVVADIENKESEEIVKRAKRELENANMLRQMYQEKFDEITKLFRLFHGGKNSVTDFIKAMDDYEVPILSDTGAALLSSLRISDSSPTSFNP